MTTPVDDKQSRISGAIIFGLGVVPASVAIRLCPDDIWAAATAGVILLGALAYEGLIRRMSLTFQAKWPEPGPVSLALAVISPLLGMGAWFWPAELTSWCEICPSMGSQESLTPFFPFIQVPLAAFAGLLAISLYYLVAVLFAKLGTSLHWLALAAGVVAFCLLAFGFLHTRSLPEASEYVTSMPSLAVLDDGDRVKLHHRFEQDGSILTIWHGTRESNQMAHHKAVCDLKPPVSIHQDSKRGLWFATTHDHRVAIESGSLRCTQLTATWRWFEVRPSAAWFAAGLAGLLIFATAQLLRRRMRFRDRLLLAAREGRIDTRGWVVIDGEESPLAADDGTARLPEGPVVVMAAEVEKSPYRVGRMQSGAVVLSGTKALLRNDLQRQLSRYDALSIAPLIVPVCPVIYPIVASGLLS